MNPDVAGGGITDWRIIPASMLILFALWILAGLALACSTRLEMISTLAICSGFFVLGLMSDYFFGTRVRDGVWWAHIPYAALPNWQLFWGGDALIGTKSIAWGRYLGPHSATPCATSVRRYAWRCAYLKIGNWVNELTTWNKTAPN